MAERRRDRGHLFLCSATILFIELTCIRWIPAYIRYLGYFTNFVLLGSFLGIGLGMLYARRRFDFVTLFPATLAILVGVVSTFKLQLLVNTSQEVFFGITEKVTVQGTESFFLLPLVFVVVTFLFALLGQNLGRLIAAVQPPLTAYTIDIVGSIVGSALFALVSFLSAPPGVWFAIAAVAVLLLPQRGRWLRAVNAVILIGVVAWVGQLGLTSLWSPYYRVDVQRHGPNYSIFVNNIGHQGMGPFQKGKTNFYYSAPFQRFHFPPSARELIIGAGTGSDADYAVHNGIRHITAVELDPTILRLGKDLNPDHVYQNRAVHTILNDGRSFLETTGGTYDLIVFALPDSLALTSSFANLRLESYLFTREAFAAARRHLSPDGVFILYNNYRTEWVMRKIAGMLTGAFGGQAPYVTTQAAAASGPALRAILMDGPRLRALPPAQYAAHRMSGEAGVAPATDDWPFVYLRQHGVPTIYIQAVLLVWLIALVALVVSLRFTGQALRAGLRHFDPALFFTGLAFLLLEAKSIVNFSLLFGSTWLVNALVTIGVLLMVLAANWINALTHLRLDIRLLYLGLAAMLAVNLLLPFETLLVPSLALRYGLGCVVLLSPILMANLIFGRLFGTTFTPDIAFASNLLGAFVGGTLEYLSLQVGYHLLLVPVSIAYVLSFIAVAARSRRDVGAVGIAMAR